MAKKKIEEAVSLPDSFTVVAADLSLKRPGFAVIDYDNGKIKIKDISSVDNKSVKCGKARGSILCEIENKLTCLCMPADREMYFVREASVNNSFFGKRSGTAARTGVSEVVGVADLTLWKFKKQEWDELYPTSIKKLITGNGKATKEEVAKSLEDYVGVLEYSNDDESDAAAVGVAWLIKHNKIEPVKGD